MCRGISPPATHSFLQLSGLFLILLCRASFLELEEVLLFVDEVGNLISSFEESFPHPDEVEEIIDAGAQGVASGCVCSVTGCLREASFKYGENFWFVERLIQAEEACRGSPEGGGRVFQARVFPLPVLPAGSVSGHIRLHVEVEDVAAGEEGLVEFLFVAQGVSLVPEEVQVAREVGVVLEI